MEWIQQHTVELLAVIGAIYALARTVVALTPTPKDDAVLSKVQVVIAAFAKVLGLNLNQGIGSSNVKKTTAISLVMLVALSSGCAAWANNPRADLLASQKVFAATVRSLAAASRAGEISDDDFKVIDVLIQNANAFLQQWELDLQDGKVDQGVVLAFNQTLSKLNAWASKYSKE